MHVKRSDLKRLELHFSLQGRVTRRQPRDFGAEMWALVLQQVLSGAHQQHQLLLLTLCNFKQDGIIP